jgi:hypothetical protein
LYPHHFDFLAENDRPPVIICGAGASHGLNPMPNEILASNRTAAEAEIAAVTGRPFPPLPVAVTSADALYVWSEIAHEELVAAKHHCPKLMIARVLGFTSDPKWLVGVSVPAGSARPRHRVIARLTREGVLYSIWTFNWDCHIENALESIGMTDGEKVEEQPWLMRYQTVLALRDYGKGCPTRTIRIHKRHGCIRDINNLSNLDLIGDATPDQYENFRFRITKDELDDVRDKTSVDYLAFRGQIVAEFGGQPLAVLGWRASEKYLLDEFETLSEQLQGYPKPVGRLSIVDPRFNDEGHVRLAQIYSVEKDQAYFPVDSAPGVPNLDDFLLWIQAIYALTLICRILGEHEPLRVWLVSLIDEVKDETKPSWITEWVDTFLPAWVQLCWRAGLVKTSYAGKPLKAEDILLENDGWYVPLRQDLPDRPELVSAAYLLRAIYDSPDSYNFSLVPGTIFRESTAELIIPIPAGGAAKNSNTLNSLTRVVGRVGAVRGFAAKVTILAMPMDGPPIGVDERNAVRSAYLSVAKLPADATVDIGELADI